MHTKLKMLYASCFNSIIHILEQAAIEIYETLLASRDLVPNIHCVKSVRIRSYSDSNAEKYGPE